MKIKKKYNNRSFLFLIIFLFLTSIISLKSLKKVYIQDFRITGSKLFSRNDLKNNISLKFPIRLISINTKFLERELKKNLTLKNVSVSKQLFFWFKSLY